MTMNYLLYYLSENLFLLRFEYINKALLDCDTLIRNEDFGNKIWKNIFIKNVPKICTDQTKKCYQCLKTFASLFLQQQQLYIFFIMCFFNVLLSYVMWPHKYNITCIDALIQLY